MNISHLPKNPTYALYRYLDEALRLTRVGVALLASVKPIVDDFEFEEIDDPDVIEVCRMADEFIFQKSVDNFQTYLADLLAEIFTTKPEMIPSGEIDRKELFQPKSLAEIRINAVESLLRKLSYRNTGDLSDWLSRNFSFPLITSREDGKVVQSMVETRNMLVHNRGMQDYRYRSEFSVGDRSRGNRIDVSKAIPTLDRLTKIAGDIDKRAAQKFGLEKVTANHA
jgi:hypothetical protein